MSGQKKNIVSKKLTTEGEKHLKVFAEHRHIYELFNKAGELVNFHHPIQLELLTAYRALKDPYYTYSMSCPICVAEFLNLIYRWYDNKTNRC